MSRVELGACVKICLRVHALSRIPYFHPITGIYPPSLTHSLFLASLTKLQVYVRSEREIIIYINLNIKTPWWVAEKFNVSPQKLGRIIVRYQCSCAWHLLSPRHRKSYIACSMPCSVRLCHLDWCFQVIGRVLE